MRIRACATALPDGAPTVTRLQAAGRFVHYLGAGLAGFDAVNRLSQGDLLGTGFNLLAGSGVAAGATAGRTVGAVQVSRLFGPIGFGVATAATVGLFVVDSVRSTQQSNEYMTETTATFLRNAGFTAPAASALRDQSGEGYNVVPLLMRYGDRHGLTPAETVAWINSLDASQLTVLRDNLHHTLDGFDGNIHRLSDSFADDSDFIAQHKGPRAGAVSAGNAAPETVAQLDAILGVLKIPLPS